MIKPWKKEKILFHLSMKHDNPSVFIKSQWQTSDNCSPWYLLTRWLIALFFIITWLLSVIELEYLDAPTSYRLKWLIYLTNWGYTMCTTQAILSAIMITSAFITQKRTDSTKLDVVTANIYKIYWAFNIIATGLALNITIIYWSLLYNGERGLTGMDLIVHGFNSIFMFLDVWIVSHPVRLLHFYWPLLFGLCYAIFTLIYYLSGGTARGGAVFIYNILNWSKPGPALLTVLAVLVLEIVLHFIFYGFYRLRVFICKKLIKTKEIENITINIAETKESNGGYDNEGLAQETA